MNYIFDTNVLLLYIRKDPFVNIIDEKFNPFDFPNRAILSVVSIGEIKALALKNGWGKRRLELLNQSLNEFIIADINVKRIIEMYAQIDAFSQNKITDRPLPNGKTARNMGNPEYSGGLRQQDLFYKQPY